MPEVVGILMQRLLGPLIAAGLQLAAALPNFLLLEYQDLMHRTAADLLEEPLVFADGRLRVPDRPGLGIDLRLEAVERYVDWGGEPLAGPRATA